jgi:N-acetylneuraminic acid mutarotase
MAIIFNNAQPWRQQYNDNELQSSDITSWAAESPIPEVIYDGQAAITKNRIYIFCKDSVYTAPIDSSGTIGGWTKLSNLPVNVTQQQCVVTKNKLYMLGGYPLNGAVQVAQINSDGTLGDWAISSNGLPTALSQSSVVVTENRVYLLGGRNSSGITDSVFTAEIDQNGTIGVWTTTTPLPSPRYDAQAVVTNNKVYYIGGVYTANIYSSSFGDNGMLGEWSLAGTIPTPIANGMSVITRSTIYLLGGENAGGRINTVYMAPIDLSGTIGEWTAGTSLPVAIYSAQVAITNSKIYLIGGVSSSSVYSAPFLGGSNEYTGWYSPSFWTNFKGQTELLV